MAAEGERTLAARIQDGVIRVPVAFGRESDEGLVVRHVNPMERAIVNTAAVGMILPHSLARKLGLEPPEPTNGNGAPHSGQWIAEGVYVAVYSHDASKILWEGRSNALVADDVNPPQVGMAQIRHWKVSINGPEGLFSIRFP